MQNIASIFILFLFLSGFNQTVYCQDPAQGGGELIFNSEHECLEETDRIAIQKELNKNIKDLTDQGILKKKNSRATVAFDWPLRKVASLEYNSYYGISNFVDQMPGGGLLDYECGTRTYNGHKGTDIFTWPFPWYLQDNDLVEIIAGESGVIISKQDGNDDDHCSCFGSWNAVYIQHSDGSVAWYGHLKENSLTSTPVGGSVVKGEYLGVLASSGCSTGPHLHLEVYDDMGNLIDPYEGGCNSLNSTSWWANQPDYREPTLNALITHETVPSHGCPSANENPHFSNLFEPGDVMFTAFYYHDQAAGDLSTYRIKQPNGSVWSSWSHTSPGTYTASWWYWSRTLPSTGPNGEWILEATYRGETFAHSFMVDDGSCLPTNNTWIGPSVGNWNHSTSYWSKGTLPEQCDNVIIPAGVAVTILNGNSAKCYTLDVPSNTILTVEPNANLEVRFPN